MSNLGRFHTFSALSTIAAATWLMLALTASPATAFQIEDRGTAGLDGKIVMSPAAERIETIRPDGGDQVQPGSKVTRWVIIHNRSDKKVDFDLDVAQVVGSSAELVVDIRHGVREGAAAWATLERRTLSLKPGQQGTVAVTIKVPAKVKPGSKPFAVTATQRTAPVQTEGAGIAPQFKQVGIFIVELPGDAEVKGGLTKATITSSQKSVAAGRSGKRAPTNSRLYIGPGWTDGHRLTLSTEYENKGERLLTPAGRVIVRDLFGRQAGSFEVKEFTVYPGGESAGTVELKGLPSLGMFTAQVELESAGAGKQTTTLPRFVMVPKWFLLAFSAFAIYGIVRIARWRLRVRREWAAYVEGEDVGGSSDAGEDEDWAEEAPGGWDEDDA